MNRSWGCVSCCLALALTAISTSNAGEPVQPLAGKNLALGKSATFSLEPNYSYSRGGDETDLTDGEYWQAGGKKGFWTDTGTVGWQFGRKPGAMITFDLGRISPIDSVSFDSSTGGAQVTFPGAVLVYVSDEGESWHYLTDLINEAIPQDKFSRHRFLARELNTRARYVALYVAKGGFYAFVDEIEILEGRHDPVSVSFQGRPIVAAGVEADAIERGRQAVQKNATLYLIQAAREQVLATKNQGSAAVLERLRRFEESAVLRSRLEEVDYSRGLPYTDLDREVCRVMGEFFAVQTPDSIIVWEPEGTIWSHKTSPFSRPSAARQPTLQMDVMIGEYEPVGFNVSNNSSKPMTVTVAVKDLQCLATGGAWPQSQIERRAATHVLASGYQFLDDALSRVEDAGVVIPAGMTRQVWLIFHSRGMRPQEYAGRVEVKGAGVEVVLPLAARVYPIEMPANPEYLSQTWSYFTCATAKGHEREAAAELERSYENAHSLHHYYVPWPKVNETTKRLVRPIEVDFTRLDEMLAYRPYVKQWLFWTGFEFGFMRLNYHRANDMPAVGTPEHGAVFKEWVRQIRDHMRQKGFGTDRWAFYWVDEPGDESYLKHVVPASRLAKEVDPTILIWEDHQVSLEMLNEYPEAIDIHCCPTSYYESHPAILKHVLAEKHPSVHYVCASSKESDPHEYYRLHHHAAAELGLNGAGMWVWGDEGGQFSDYAGEHTSYAMVYATPDGPMTGKRREAWREGVEDFELFRHLAKAAGESENGRLKRLVDQFDREHNSTPEALLKAKREILKAVTEYARKER